MSDLSIGNASGWGIPVLPVDPRLNPVGFRMDVEMPPMVEATVGTSFQSPWWPKSYLMGDAGDVDLLDTEVWDGYEPYESVGGGAQRFAITGYVRDAYGAVLPGAEVTLYRASTDEMCDMKVADANGAYWVTTPYYPDAHYIVVFYRLSGPLQSGVTADNLIGG